MAGYAYGRTGQCVFATIVLLIALAGQAGAQAPATGDPTDRHPAYRSEHYCIHSDLDPRLVRELGKELDWLSNAYATRMSVLAVPRPSDEPYTVRLYSHRDDYIRHNPNGGSTTAGLYDSRRRLLAAFNGDGGTERLKRTLRHEAFHQWAYESIGPGLPVWANEGIAQLFEYAVRVDDQMMMGEVPEVSLKIVKMAIAEGRLIGFERMIRMTSREWFRLMEDEQASARLYAQAWAMTHFLAYAQDAHGRPLYRDRFNRFLTDIAEGRPAQAAFRRSFGTNVDGFQRRFTQFVLQLEPTPLSRQLDMQNILGAMVIHLAERGDRFDTIEDLRRNIASNGLQLYRDQAGVSRVSDSDPMVYFRDTRGRVMGRDRMMLHADLRGELPQLVVRPGDGHTYRTRFYRQNDLMLTETRVSRRR